MKKRAARTRAESRTVMLELTHAELRVLVFTIDVLRAAVDSFAVHRLGHPASTVVSLRKKLLLAYQDINARPLSLRP